MRFNVKQQRASVNLFRDRLLKPALDKRQASRRVYPGGSDGGLRASPLAVAFP